MYLLPHLGLWFERYHLLTYLLTFFERDFPYILYTSGIYISLTFFSGSIPTSRFVSVTHLPPCETVEWEVSFLGGLLYVRGPIFIYTTDLATDQGHQSLHLGRSALS